MAVKFDVLAACEKWSATASIEKFKKEEEERFPRYDLMPLSAEEINSRFRNQLDALKEEQGFVAGNIYISSYVLPDSSRVVTSVELGEVLLDLQVTFRPLVNVRKLADKPDPNSNHGAVLFSFEEEVRREYNRCASYFDEVYEQLKTADNARSVPQTEREMAIRFIEVAFEKARERLSLYRKAKAPNAAKKQMKMQLAHLSLLEARLKMLDPRRAQSR